MPAEAESRGCPIRKKCPRVTENRLHNARIAERFTEATIGGIFPVCGLPLDSITLGVGPLEARHKLAYTIKYAARLIGLSRQTITRIFKGEQGLMVVKRHLGPAGTHAYQLEDGAF